MKWLFIFFTCFFSLNLSANEMDKSGYINKNAYIIGNNINLRNMPALRSKVVKTLAFGVLVKILDIDTSYQTITRYKNFWFKIQTGNQTGWVFGAYLLLTDKHDSFIKYKNKELIVNEWKDVASLSPSLSAKTNFITGENAIPVYKSIEDIKRKKSTATLKEIFFFEPINSFIHEKKYEKEFFIQFIHPKLGTLWVQADSIHGVADIYETKKLNLVLTTTQPVLEGDRMGYRIFIVEKNTKKIIYATKPFVDIGSYANAEIKKVEENANTIEMHLDCYPNMDPYLFQKPTDNQFKMIHVQIKNNKVSRIYETHL